MEDKETLLLGSCTKTSLSSRSVQYNWSYFVKVTVACLYIGCLYTKELCIEFQDSSTALFASREHLLECSFNCQQSGKQFLTSPLASFPGSPPKWKICFINPWRACAARVTVVVLCVCLCIRFLYSAFSRF